MKKQVYFTFQDGKGLRENKNILNEQKVGALRKIFEPVSFRTEIHEQVLKAELCKAHGWCLQVIQGQMESEQQESISL